MKQYQFDHKYIWDEWFHIIAKPYIYLKGESASGYLLLTYGITLVNTGHNTSQLKEDSMLVEQL